MQQIWEGLFQSNVIIIIINYGSTVKINVNLIRKKAVDRIIPLSLAISKQLENCKYCSDDQKQVQANLASLEIILKIS